MNKIQLKQIIKEVLTEEKMNKKEWLKNSVKNLKTILDDKNITKEEYIKELRGMADTLNKNKKYFTET